MSWLWCFYFALLVSFVFRVFISFCWTLLANFFWPDSSSIIIISIMCLGWWFSSSTHQLTLHFKVEVQQPDSKFNEWNQCVCLSFPLLWSLFTYGFVFICYPHHLLFFLLPSFSFHHHWMCLQFWQRIFFSYLQLQSNLGGGWPHAQKNTYFHLAANALCATANGWQSLLCPLSSVCALSTICVHFDCSLWLIVGECRVRIMMMMMTATATTKSRLVVFAWWVLDCLILSHSLGCKAVVVVGLCCVLICFTLPPYAEKNGTKIGFCFCCCRSNVLVQFATHVSHFNWRLVNWMWQSGLYDDDHCCCCSTGKPVFLYCFILFGASVVLVVVTMIDEDGRQ